MLMGPCPDSRAGNAGIETVGPIMSISRIHRLLRLITMLQGSRRYTAAELADELEVSKRTIFRDLNMLELAGIPYFFDHDAGGYAVSPHFFLPAINLSLTEALAVLLLTGRAGRGPGPAGDTPLLSAAVQAATKIESALPSSVSRHVGSVLRRLDVTRGPVARHVGLDDLFAQLTEAVSRRRICQILYLSFYERKQMRLTVRPLRMAFVRRAWYVIAYSAHHREIRTFKITRIRKLTVTERTFDEPRDVDLDKHFGRAWGMIPEGKVHNIHLHFKPKVAGNVVEVFWHESQRVRFNDDGSADVWFRVDGIREISWWILGYGDQVQVLAPAALRRRVAKTAAGMLQIYRRQDGGE